MSSCIKARCVGNQEMLADLTVPLNLDHWHKGPKEDRAKLARVVGEILAEKCLLDSRFNMFDFLPLPRKIRVCFVPVRRGPDGTVLRLYHRTFMRVVKTAELERHFHQCNNNFQFGSSSVGEFCTIYRCDNMVKIH